MVSELTAQVETPLSFSTRERADETTMGIRAETLSISELEHAKLQKIETVLNDPYLDQLIDDGKLTLGIIKPHANEGKGLPGADGDAAGKLMEEVGEENIIFSFSTRLSSEQAREFYSDIIEQYKEIPLPNGDGKNVWDSINEFSQSGPLTFLLIYRPEGGAVQWWRERMGKTKATEADPESIRGKYAIQENLPNNLTHGSDSEESVKKEVRVLRYVVSELEGKSSEIAHFFPSAEFLTDLNILTTTDQLVSINRFFDSGRGSESWIYGYELTYTDSDGVLKQKRIKEKNGISMGGGNTKRMEEQLDRVHHLESIGIPVPETYGARKASLYQEFIVNDQTDEVYRSLNKDELNDVDIARMDQLIDIAARLDIAGYFDLDYLRDLMFDGDKNKFVFMDVGSDLGARREGYVSEKARETLETRFRKHKDFISSRYSQKTQDLAV